MEKRMDMEKLSLHGSWKGLFAGIMAAIILIMTIPSPVQAAVEGSVTARVTVSAYINFTVVDYGSAGLKFGSLTPGSINNPEVNQNVEGAVSLQMGADSNVNCVISTKASDFTSGVDKLPVDNVTWNTSSNAGTATSMTDQYAVITTLKPGESQDVWHWLNVPVKQAPGIYSADFYYQATRVT